MSNHILFILLGEVSTESLLKGVQQAGDRVDHLLEQQGADKVGIAVCSPTSWATDTADIFLQGMTADPYDGIEKHKVLEAPNLCVYHHTRIEGWRQLRPNLSTEQALLTCPNQEVSQILKNAGEAAAQELRQIALRAHSEHVRTVLLCGNTATLMCMISELTQVPLSALEFIVEPGGITTLHCSVGIPPKEFAIGEIAYLGTLNEDIR